jgi:hypothetical protein
VQNLEESYAILKGNISQFVYGRPVQPCSKQQIMCKRIKIFRPKSLCRNHGSIGGEIIWWYFELV